jgi:polysaccharide biosynthesis protein PslH
MRAGASRAPSHLVRGVTTRFPESAPRVLVLSRQLPYPPRTGGALREIHIVRALATIGPTYVFGLAGAGPPPPTVELAGWDASCDPAASSMPHGDKLMAALRAGESPFHVRVSETAADEVDSLIGEFAPDIVVVRGNELSGYIPQLRARDARLILDSDFAFAEAVHAMGTQDPNRARGIMWRHASSLVARQEAEAVGLVDQIWVAHTESQDSLRASYPDAAPVMVIPNVVDVDSYPQSTREHPLHVLYTGRFDFWPNEEAAATLVRELLPLLEHASLSIVGIAPTQWMREVDDPRVTVTGAVDDVRPYLQQAGVLAVPLRAGSGTRLKVLEAFAASVPVVSTAKGVEGLHLVDGVHYLNAETVEEFAAAIEELALEPARAAAMTTAAHTLVAERFSLPALERLVGSALAVDRAN